jgi:putative ABC transport system permease protein
MLFHAFILRHLSGQPVRTAATVLGIALGVAVVLAVRMANQSSVESFRLAVETMAGKTSLEVVSQGRGLDERLLISLSWLTEYGETSPVIEGDIQIQNRHGEFESVRVLGADMLRDLPFREYRLLDLGGPAPSGAAEASVQDEVDPRKFLDLLLDPDSIVLTEKYARRNDLQVGARVEVFVGDESRTLRVAGLLRNIGPARTLDGNFGLMDIAAAQWLFDRLGYLDRLDIRLRQGVELERTEAAIAGRLPDGLGVQRPARRGRQVEKMLAAFHFNLSALSYTALLVGLFLIYNNVSISVVARREEIGMLRALGATRFRILSLFLTEAGLLAAVGCALGLILGRFLAYGAVAITSTTVNSLYVTSSAPPPPLNLGHLALAFGVGIPFSLLAAALPAAEASRVPPTAAIRGAERAVAGRRRAGRLLLLALALGLASWWMARWETVYGLPLGGYGSALSLVFASSFAIPAAFWLVLRAGRRGLGAALGVEGRLASANLEASLRRISVPVAALVVSLAMMVAIAVMVGSFRETVIYWVNQTLEADLYVRPASRTNVATESSISPEAERLILLDPAIDAVSRYRNFDLPYEDALITVAGGDFEAQLRRGNLVFKAPADAASAMKRAVERGEVIVSESFSVRYRTQPGDSVTLPTPAGSRMFRIAAVYYDYSSDRGVVVMDNSAMATHFGPQRPTNLTLFLKSGADPDEVRAQILSRLGSQYRYFVYTNASLKNEVLRVFDNTFAITYALQVIAIFIAILGVVTSLLTLILERRADLVTLRLLGAERRQVRMMVMIESGIMGAVSQGFGIVVGFLLSLVLIYVINVQSFGWTIQFHVPWSFLLQTTLLILIATVLSGVYPAHLATRSRPVEQNE